MELQQATEVVTWEVTRPGVMTVTMNRGPANALGVPLLDGLHAAFDAAEAAGDIKVVVIRSAIDGFFAAGADIKHLGTIDAESFTAYGDKMRAVNDRLEAADFLSIAAVDGLTLGGGMELAMACTFRVATAAARFGLPEVKIGLIPGAGGTQRLPRLVGRGAALDIILTGRQVALEEAKTIRLVDRVADSDVMDAAFALIDEFEGASLPAQIAGIRSVDAAYDLPFDEGAEVEIQQEQGLFEHGEAQEGIQAFIAKRRPNFA